MQPPDDAALLAAYATHNSEEAFAELVRRYVALVYSAALRQVHEPQLAEEVTQAVFILLARKAQAMSRHPTLSGWLCRVAYFVSRDALRIERRRLHRERIAAQMETTVGTNWMQIAPLLDEVVAKLDDKDRSAVVLRFYEGRSLEEVGKVLGVDADTAQKRVSRALEKLRKFFTKRGVTSTTAIIAGAISANSVQAAPTALTGSVTAVAIANGASASSSTLALLKGALKLMAWSQAKTAAVTGVVVLLAAGTTTVTIKEIQEHKTYSWQVPEADFAVFYKTPAQIKIVPTKFDSNGGTVCDEGRGAMGIAQSVEEILHFAYQKDQLRTVIACEMPSGKYDYFAKLPNSPTPSKDWTTALQKEITRKFGVTGRLEEREADVFILKPGSAGARGFKISHSKPNGRAMVTDSGGFLFFEQPVAILGVNLEQYVKAPIIDRTGLTEHYDFTLKWNETGAKQPNLEELKQALHDQLGLELVPAREPIEMLIVEKVK